ncbi:hypothetical protein [Fredinandcohnia quinoae]|uniref:Uncharacterized protein n=1 Tax=Fredinandcohnia quinoae TaxID=2918902 RepID=A0AAW5E992_9BACI|nr:hypothetical protein [Fredinandcohnia sp. SECRCQ15]MCH1625329.1 hypothetical protein [Fredinandcohnia sp. SECRCQ15]
MDLVEIEMNIDLDTLSINNRNVITGEIYFSFNGEYFPERGWNDFIVVILTWWHTALINLKNSRQNGIVQEFDFMDGPLLVRGFKISDDIIELRFIRKTIGSEHIFFTCQTSINSFKKTLLKRTKQLLTDIKGRNWKSGDIEELEKLWKILGE